VRDRVPVHDHDIAQKDAQSADIDQQDFHSSPINRSRKILACRVGERGSAGPIQRQRRIANCYGLHQNSSG
jgi:hypothetical protein